MDLKTFALILIIIGVCLVALEWCLGYYGPRPATRPRRTSLLYLGVILIGIGVMLGNKTLS